MLSNLETNKETFLIFYIYVYLLTVLYAISVFSSTSTYKNNKLSSITDLSLYSRYNLIFLMIIVLLFLLSGMPPFLTFTSKFCILSILYSHNTLLFITIYITSFLAYYINIFKFIKVKSVYKCGIEFISYTSLYIFIIVIVLSLLISYPIHDIILSDLF